MQCSTATKPFSKISVNAMQHELAVHGLHARVVPFPVNSTSGCVREPPVGALSLLFVGRMENIKGGRLVIDAMPTVVNHVRKSVHLVMAGDGRERAHWQQRAQSVQSSTANLAVEFTGWVTQERVAALMKQATLLVVPSLWPEPLGSVGPAAGLHGVPAAGFAVGGIQQWLVDGVTGHLASANPPTALGLADAILRCLQDDGHYRALRRGARSMAETFTMKRHLPELIAILRRVAAMPLVQSA